MTISPATSPPRPGLPLALIGLGGLVMAVSIGLRAGLGVVVVPYSLLQGWPLATFSLAMAAHNLLWGLVQPLVGLVADLKGTRGVILFGALAYAGGLAATALAASPAAALAGAGGAVGLGLACASFPVVLALVGRACAPGQRAQAMGLAIAVGSFGQVLVPPAVGWAVERFGVVVALAAMAGLAALMAPLAFTLGSRPDGRGAAPLLAARSGAALATAWGVPGYRHLVIGFFACGFQLAFISLHLPGHLALCGQPASTGGVALAVMGAFNVIGCWLFGHLGGRWRLSRLLALLYALRALAVAGFLAVPLSQSSLLAFSALTGLTWLATVPLTSALIARLFGVGSLGLLFGVAFLSHQLGSFAGALAGGWVFDATGSYDWVWVASGLLGLIAAVLHWPIPDHPPAGFTAPA